MAQNAPFAQDPERKQLASNLALLNKELSQTDYANPQQGRIRLNLIHNVATGLQDYLGSGSPDAARYAQAMGYASAEQAMQAMQRIAGLAKPMGAPDTQAYVPTSQVILDFQKRLAAADPAVPQAPAVPQQQAPGAPPATITAPQQTAAAVPPQQQRPAAPRGSA